MSVFISPAAAAVSYVKEETGIFHPGSRWRTRGGQWTVDMQLHTRYLTAANWHCCVVCGNDAKSDEGNMKVV